MSQPLFTVVLNARVVLAGTWAQCSAEAAKLASEGARPVIKRATGVADERARKSGRRAASLIVHGTVDPEERKRINEAARFLNATGQYGWSGPMQAWVRNEGLTVPQCAWIVAEYTRIKARERSLKGIAQRA